MAHNERLSLTLIFILILSFRLCVALYTETFFQPDEFFQSLEVAHRAVFGYGHLTWEWTSPAPIRSPIYPTLYMPVYVFLKLLGMDHTRLLILLPKALNALTASLMDFSLCKVTEKTLGWRYVSTALFLSLTSLFNALSLTRSLSNSLETSLTTMAFSYFPWNVGAWSKEDLRKSLFFAALACCIRPTNAVIWLYAFGMLLPQLRLRPNMAASVLADALIIGGAAVAFVFAVDSLYYGQPTLTPLNFLLTNLRVASFYGTNQWHFYLTQALPLLCTTALPFVLHGAVLLTQSRPSATLGTHMMAGVVLWTILVYSLSAHKEWRFLHPILPLLHILAAKSLVGLGDLSSPGLHSPTIQTSEGKATLRRWVHMPPIRRKHLALLLLNLPAAYYVLRWHGGGQINVMHYLRGVPARELDSLGFLMPCHSTPWQAYLHRRNLAMPGRMWAIGCEPPPPGEDMRAYRDQSDVFYADPLEYLKQRFPDKVNITFPPSSYPATEPGSRVLAGANGAPAWSHEWPRYLAVFGALLDQDGVKSILAQKGYKEVWVGANGWSEDARRRGGVRVWKWQGHGYA